MADRELLRGVNPELTYAWAQETLAEHGREMPFTLLQMEQKEGEMRTVVELPNPGGEPFTRSGSSFYEETSPEMGKLKALQSALRDDYPKVDNLSSFYDSGYLSGNEREYFFETSDNEVLNSYAKGKNAIEVALVEGVASYLLTKE